MFNIIKFLRARAEDVSVLLLLAMSVVFIVQITARYVFNYPVGWTLELCLTIWLWLVLWGAAFVLSDEDQVKFDLFYIKSSPSRKRVLALISSAIVLVTFLISVPATADFIDFYKIKKSVTMRIPLNYVFSIYGIFLVSVIIRQCVKIVSLLRNGHGDASGEGSPK